MNAEVDGARTYGGWRQRAKRARLVEAHEMQQSQLAEFMVTKSFSMEP